MKYSKAFLKIKKSIKSALNENHLFSCRMMIENATPILTKDETTILKEYLSCAYSDMAPGESLADEADTYMHKLTCGAH